MSIIDFTQKNIKWVEYVKDKIKQGVTVDEIHAELKQVMGDALDFTVEDMQGFLKQTESFNTKALQSDEQEPIDDELAIELNETWLNYERLGTSEKSTIKSSLRDAIEFKLLHIINERLNEGRVPKDEIIAFKSFKGA